MDEAVCMVIDDSFGILHFPVSFNCDFGNPQNGLQAMLQNVQKPEWLHFISKSSYIKLAVVCITFCNRCLPLSC